MASVQKSTRRQNEIAEGSSSGCHHRATGWLQKAARADTYAGTDRYLCASDTGAPHGHISARDSLSGTAYGHTSAGDSLSGATHAYTSASDSLSQWVGVSRRECRLPPQMLDKKLILGLLLGLAALISGCAASIVETDNVQERLDKAAPAIAGSQTVGQTFVSHYPRFCAVELLLVVYDDAPPDTPRNLTFHLRSYPQNEADIVTLTVDTSRLKHNDPCRFFFPPQAGSENKTYYFFLEATEGNRTTVWYNSPDAYGEGTMYLDGEPCEGDLYFKTYYDYTLGVIARDIWRGLRSSGWLILPLLSLFILPGYLLYSLLPIEPELEPLEHLALVVGLSLALVPLALLLCSVLGLALNGTRVLIAVVILSVGALWRLASTGFRDFRRWLSSDNRPFVMAFLFIFALSLTVRFLHIRNLVVPAWIDSVHHTLITQLIVAKGGVPQSYESLLPIGEFVYHFGFHSLVAVFHWLTGVEIPRAMLIVGQVINGLMVLSAYLLAKCLTGRRLAGLFAALIVGLISFMPAYYVSWGRYTQLTGLVLLPSTIVFTMRALGQPGKLVDWETGKLVDWETGKSGNQFTNLPIYQSTNLLIAAVSAAGLLLTHYRVLIFYGGFVVAYLLYETFTHRHEPAAFLRYWSRAATVGFLAALLILPWLANLVHALWPLTTLPSRMQGAPSFNAFPYDLVMIGNNRALIVLSVCGLLWGLYKRERAVTVTMLWVVIVTVITNPTVLGLPSTWLVNNASLAISLFIPLAILGGYFLTSVSDLLSVQYPISNIRQLTLALAITLVALWGAWEMLPIVNPGTVLATRYDMAAMDWIRHNIPSDARFLINVRHWQGGTYVGTDGGYWIPLLAGRDTVLPPAVYLYGSGEYVKGINDLAEAIVAAESFDAENIRQLLSDNGVTHVYVGARGGPITPQMLTGSAHYHAVYSNGAVWIFEFQR
jgi:hypothetical protein